jgi:hypothetical protein
VSLKVVDGGDGLQIYRRGTNKEQAVMRQPIRCVPTAWACQAPADIHTVKVKVKLSLCLIN